VQIAVGAITTIRKTASTAVTVAATRALDSLISAVTEPVSTMESVLPETTAAATFIAIPDFRPTVTGTDGGIVENGGERTKTATVAATETDITATVEEMFGETTIAEFWEFHCQTRGCILKILSSAIALLTSLGSSRAISQHWIFPALGSHYG
jgi:hypothetical protein